AVAMILKSESIEGRKYDSLRQSSKLLEYESERDGVYDHLIAFGFTDGYDEWIFHGEEPSSGINVNDDHDHDFNEHDDIDGLLHDTFRDVLNDSLCYVDDPFVMASQVQQVFYVEDPHGGGCHYVMKRVPDDIFDSVKNDESNASLMEPHEFEFGAFASMLRRNWFGQEKIYLELKCR
ncbi:hypothetical protein Dimus_007428, partial [Dionaea muscipula]